MRTVAAAGVLLVLSAVAVDAGAARHGKRQLWGAIAYHTTTGSYGFSVDRKTKREAETEAFSQCGPDCDLIKTFRDACGAIAENPRSFAWETGASREIAEAKALKKCGAACAIKVWACTSEK